MPSLKSFRDRIKSVVSTRKITSAMKMVAASKLRRAEEQANSSRPYGQFMDRMMHDLGHDGEAPKLLTGTGKTDKHLIIVATADRGLCGAFNSSIVRRARLLYQILSVDGKEVKFFCIGNKGYNLLSREFSNEIVEHIAGIGKPRITFSEATDIAENIIARFDSGEFDVCSIIFNTFVSVIRQEVTEQRLIPVNFDEAEAKANEDPLADEPQEVALTPALYEYEPSQAELLAELLPKNLAMQIYRALLENAASEQGARMAAMDNATRNAGEMIKKLKLKYNRTRQEYITKELIDIVSGAESI